MRIVRHQTTEASQEALHHRIVPRFRRLWRRKPVVQKVSQCASLSKSADGKLSKAYRGGRRLGRVVCTMSFFFVDGKSKAGISEGVGIDPINALDLVHAPIVLWTLAEAVGELLPGFSVQIPQIDYPHLVREHVAKRVFWGGCDRKRTASSVSKAEACTPDVDERPIAAGRFFPAFACSAERPRLTCIDPAMEMTIAVLPAQPKKDVRCVCLRIERHGKHATCSLLPFEDMCSVMLADDLIHRLLVNLLLAHLVTGLDQNLAFTKGTKQNQRRSNMIS